MKNVIVIGMLVCQVVAAQNNRESIGGSFGGGIKLTPAQLELKKRQQTKEEADQAARREAQLRKDTAENVAGQDWRDFAGAVRKVPVHLLGTSMAEGWVDVAGKVQQKTGKNLLVSGRVNGGDEVFFMLRNYPKLVVDEDSVRARALYVEDVSYTTVLGAKKTVRVFDCGVPCAPPLAEVARAEAARLAREDAANAAAKVAAEVAEKEKIRQAEVLLRFHQTNAVLGYASAQVSLARRYLTGDGVPVDKTLARHWLEKAAAQDDSEAKKLLTNLAP